jgi:hypothetical protein
MLSQEAIAQFQTLYLAEFGKKISVKEAQLKASKLLNLYRAVYVGNQKLTIKNKNNNEKKIQPPKNHN